MSEDFVKAISTFEDRQKVAAFARGLGYSLVELVGIERKTRAHLHLRNTVTLRTQRSPGTAGGANRSGSRML